MRLEVQRELGHCWGTVQSTRIMRAGEGHVVDKCEVYERFLADRQWRSVVCLCACCIDASVWHTSDCTTDFYARTLLSLLGVKDVLRQCVGP
jgi:hypothetical protein